MIPRRALLAVLLAAPAASAGAPADFEPVPVLLKDFEILGVGRVNEIFKAEMNSGLQWVAHTSIFVSDDDADEVVLKDGVLLWLEGQLLPAPGALLLDTIRSVDIADDGRAMAVFGTDDGVVGTELLTAAYLDHQLLKKSGDPVGLPGAAPGSTYVTIKHAYLNDSQQALVQCYLDLVTTGGEALVVWDLGPPGVVGETLVAMDGQMLPGASQPVTDFSDSLGRQAINDAGQVLFTVHLTGVGALYLDKSLILEEGDGIPGTAEVLHFMLGDNVALDDEGQWAIESSSQGTLVDVVLAQGELVAQELAPFPGVDGDLQAFTLGVDRGTNGSVLWRGATPSPNPAAYLFLNRSVLLQTGASTIGGVTITGFAAPTFGYVMKLIDDGEQALFTARLGTDVWGLFRMNVDPWVDLGQGLAGTGGVPPVLAGEGPMTSGSNGLIEVQGALPGASAFLILGLSELAAPFKGGTLVPNPDVLVGPFGVNAQGGLEVPFTLPEPLLGDVDLYLQAWVVDPAGPAGYASTNALVATTI